MAEMQRIGVTSPENLWAMWQDYLTRQQLAPQLRYNFPQRRPVEDVSPHRVKVKNTESEIIPAFACMRITGVEDIGGQTCIKVEKPSSLDGEFLFNGPFPIAVPAEATGETPAELGVGWAYRHGVVTMLGDEPTEPGAAFKPIVDSWEIEEGGDKFAVFGRHDFSARALVGRFDGKKSNRPAVIGSALTAPASSLAVATSCTIYFLERQSDGTQELNTTAETAYNDDPEITADVGTYCRVESLNGRWMIYYLGCDIQSALVAVVPEA